MTRDISYYRQLPITRLFEIVKGAAVTPTDEPNWKHVSIALMERIEAAVPYDHMLYDE